MIPLGWNVTVPMLTSQRISPLSSLDAGVIHKILVFQRLDAQMPPRHIREVNQGAKYMGIIVEPGDPRHPEATALLHASHALMQELFDAEDNHFLSIDDLCVPEVLFFVAREYDTTLGCGALALRAGYGEVKSMFTTEFARGNGVAAMILSRLELEARARDLPMLRLETGNTLFAAHRLYERQGFTRRGPFGDYPESPASVFMEKLL